MAKPETFDQYNRPEAGGLETTEPSMTKLEFAAETDLNRIMARYTQTGELPQEIIGTYGDFSEGIDYHQAQNIILRADAQFNALPAEVRARFSNDPAEFLDFVHDPENLDEALELGLLTKEGEKRAREAKAAVEAAIAPKTAEPAPAPSSPKAS